MEDWKARANKRRDERHTKTPETNRPTPAKKNTKKWCKGKVGREHQTRVMSGEEKNRSFQHVDGSKFVSMKNWKFLICIVCGKELDIYYGGSSKRKPDWAK